MQFNFYWEYGLFPYKMWCIGVLRIIDIPRPAFSEGRGIIYWIVVILLRRTRSISAL